MNNSLHQHGSSIHPASGFGFIAAHLQIFDDFVQWLVGFIWLTEQEQMDAGIYLGDQFFTEIPTPQDNLKT